MSLLSRYNDEDGELGDVKYFTCLDINGNVVNIPLTEIYDLIGSTPQTQSELDDTQVGAGLDDDGTYSPNVGTNYIKTATSLKNADEKLDMQVKSNTDGLSAEAITRAAADTLLQNNIDTEESARTAADNTLQGNIDSEESDRISADSTLQNSISAEASVRSSADISLQNNIDALKTDDLVDTPDNKTGSGGYFVKINDAEDEYEYVDEDGWDDLRFSAAASNLYSPAARLDYNFFNGTAVFASNARYPEEQYSCLAQMPHAWQEGSELRPHIHWLQQGSDVPNWLMAYKIYDNNAPTTIDTDFSGYTFSTSTNVFTYTSGILVQISVFDPIDMTGYTLSDMLHLVIFRDSSNVSGLFAGSDPSSISEHLLEFDIHYFQDRPTGSVQEFIKYA